MKQNVRTKVMSLLMVLVLVAGSVFVTFAEAPADKPVIGISWSYDGQSAGYAKHKAAIEAVGGIAVELPQIICTAVHYDENDDVVADDLEPSGMLKQIYADIVKAGDFTLSNVAEALEGIDGVFFTGGEDISPSLYAIPQVEANLGEGINATRDISDYILMDYCIENNIPTFAVCRGEQMMGIVSGCQFVQDIGNYYEAQGVTYGNTHRMPAGAVNRTYARHSVTITDPDSFLAQIVGAPILENVSSWHHQCISSVEGTNLKETASTITGGVKVVEGIEVIGHPFCVGVQFHPENDCALVLVQGKPEAAKCDFDTCMRFFEMLVTYAAK